MTFTELQSALAAGGKPVKEAQIFRYLKRLHISQVGRNQRPAHYPPDTAVRILTDLGLIINGDVKDQVRELHGRFVPLPAVRHSASTARKNRAKGKKS